LLEKYFYNVGQYVFFAKHFKVAPLPSHPSPLKYIMLLRHVDMLALLLTSFHSERKWEKGGQSMTL